MYQHFKQTRVLDHLTTKVHFDHSIVNSSAETITSFLQDNLIGCCDLHTEITILTDEVHMVYVINLGFFANSFHLKTYLF